MKAILGSPKNAGLLYLVVLVGSVVVCLLPMCIMTYAAGKVTTVACERNVVGGVDRAAFCAQEDETTCGIPAPASHSK